MSPVASDPSISGIFLASKIQYEIQYVFTTKFNGFLMDFVAQNSTKFHEKISSHEKRAKIEKANKTTVFPTLF